MVKGQVECWMGYPPFDDKPQSIYFVAAFLIVLGLPPTLSILQSLD